MTRRKLGALIGATASYVAFMECNQRRPSLALLVLLANALGLNGRELLPLSHPDAIALIGRPRARRAGLPNDAWRRFASNRGLHRRYRISHGELGVLRQIARQVDVSSPDQFVYILNAIRHAAISIE